MRCRAIGQTRNRKQDGRVDRLLFPNPMNQSGLLPLPLASLSAVSAAPVEDAINTSGKVFLGAPALSTHRLFDGRGARNSITLRT